MESLTRPFFHHRRKHSTASSGNGLSFSGKNEYEELLSGGNKKTKLRRGVVVEDYGEIFGGCAGVRGSSIPVLELSDLDTLNGSGELPSSNGQLDYSRIFRGLAGGDDEIAAGAVPPYEELFGGAYKSKYDKAKPQETAHIGSPMKGLDNPKDSDHDTGCFSEASDQNVDGSKKLNMSYHKTSQQCKDGTNGTRHVAQLDAVPGFTFFVNGDTDKQKQDHDKAIPDEQLSDGKSGGRANWKPQNTHVPESIINGIGGTDRDSVGVNRKLFYSGEIDVKPLKVPPPSSSPIDQSRPKGKPSYSGELDKAWPSNGTRHVAQLDAVPGFTFFVNGDTDKQKQYHDKAIPDEQLSDGKSGGKANWKPQNTHVPEGIINGIGGTDRDSVGVNRKLFYSGEIDVKPLKVPPPSSSPIDQSRQKGKPSYSGELDKAWPSNVPPPSSLRAKLYNDKVHLNQSKSFASKVDPLEKDAGDHLTPSDEELDGDSSAAVSAAAMKKAIQQAQESIRFAKGLTDWKQDSMKMRSRSALKVKNVRETEHDQHITSLSENNMKDARNVVDTKASVSRELDQNLDRENAEVISDVKDRDALLVNRKIDGQKQEENAEAVEGGMSTWFTHLLNNGKNKMAAFASQLVDKKNESILPEKSDQIEDAEMTKSEKMILEKNNSEKTETVARVVDPKDAVSGLSTFDRATDFNKNVISDPDVLVQEGKLTAQVDETTRKIHHKFERGMSDKELEDSQEKTDSKKLGYGNREKDHPVKNFIDLVEREYEVNMSFKLEKKKMLDAVSGLEENNCTLDAVDTARNVEDFCQVIDNEGQPSAPAGNGNDEKQLEDVLEIRLECYNMHETGEQMPLHSHDVVNLTFSKEECLQAQPSQRITNKNEHGATDCGYGGTTEIVENQETDVAKELKETDCAEGEIGEGKDICNTSTWPKYANNNHLNGYLDSHNIDDVNMPSENSELCGLETNICNEQKSHLEVENSLKDNILAGHEKQPCQLEGKNSEGNYDLNSEGNRNEIENEIEEALRSKESEVCETSYLNQSNEQGDLFETLGTHSEGNEELDCEEDEKQAEQASEDPFWLKESELYETSYMDRNNKEGDVLETIGRQNEENDDLECEVDAKEVEQAVGRAFRLKQNENFETSYLDQNNVQGDEAETTFQDVSEALPSDSKIDNFGFAATTHEVFMHEGLPTDVDLLKTSAFIHIGTEDHDIENDRDDNPPLSEKSSLNCCFIGTNGGVQIGKNGEGPNFVLGPENTTGMVRDACTENIMEDVNNASEKEVEKDNNVKDHQENDWIEKDEEPNSAMPNIYEGSREHLETDSVIETGQNMECYEENLNRTERESVETREAKQNETVNNNYLKKFEVIKRERERQNDRVAVERAIREARERAFAEACERAERAAVEKANSEARQRALLEAREKLGKVASGTKVSSDKSSIEAKLKAERAAVERATAEARERALEKAMSQKTDTEARPPGGKVGVGKSPGVYKNNGIKHSVSSPDLGRIDESNTESAQRRKARLERHQRIMDRAAKALAEKNMRDILAQREQSERNRLAETLDAEIKRWASGKEGNLRALLSTLQYILGANSGWQPITLTEIITTSAVKKAYKKATLYVHPDKLQQKGASIQQKYICEKVFDLLQAARNKFNSEER